MDYLIWGGAIALIIIAIPVALRLLLGIVLLVMLAGLLIYEAFAEWRKRPQ